MPFWEGTQAEETALKAIVAIYNAGNLLTNQNLQNELQAQGALFTASPNLVEVTMDGSDNVTLVRSAKINYYILRPFGGAGQQTLSAIIEGNQFSDGDTIYLFSKENRLINVRLSNVSVNLWEAGNFLKLTRAYGVWGPEAKNPDVNLPYSAHVDEVTVLSSDTELNVTHAVLKVSAVTAPTPASAVYEITAIANPGGIINLYVDGILIGTGDDNTTIDTMGTDLETEINAGTSFTAVYNAGTNQLTISDAQNLGTAGDSFLLSADNLNGATGTVISQFAGGVDGVAANVTIDTINGLVVGNSYQIHNAMAANTVTLTDVGGNLVGSVCPLVLAAGDWAWVSCTDANVGRVK